MNLDSVKSIMLRDLDPELQQEIHKFVSDIGYEVTITGSTRLGFLVEIYEKSDRENLKKAENMILKLASVQNAIKEREERRRSERREKSGVFRIGMLEGGVSASKKTRELLGSIGITDEGIMERAEALLGPGKIEERVEDIWITSLGKDVVKKIFGEYPEIILIPDENNFISELEAMETKKEMIDEWAKTTALPAWVDYNQTPGILLDSYQEISRQLGIPVPEEKIKEKEEKYVSRPMKKAEMVKVLAQLGFELKRKVKELVFEGPKSLTISDPHDGEYDPITVRKIVRDIGVTPGEFEAARKAI